MRLMTLFTAHRAPWLAIALSGGLLVGAWIFQYGFGYAPCQMCYWQRYAHMGVIALAVLILIASRLGISRPRLFAGLLALALLGSAAMGLWHMGVEYKWWEGPKTCLATGVDLDRDGKSLIELMDQTFNPPACSDAVWHFLGLSMAAWNMILSFGGALVMMICAGRGTTDDG